MSGAAPGRPETCLPGPRQPLKNITVERNFKPGGPIRINHKDIKNVVNTAHAIDVPIPYTAQLYEIMQTLKIHGHMEDDHGGIVQYFEKLADVEVKKVD